MVCITHLRDRRVDEFHSKLRKFSTNAQKKAASHRRGWCQSKAGTEVPASRNSYLLMESLLIDPPLSIFTLMMWIWFLSAYTCALNCT